jgi:cellulase/cellobiase CelA1
LTVLAAFLLTLVTPDAFAQVTHVSNPYVGATVYASPDYVTEVQSATTANPSWASQIAIVGNTPTFVWMDHIGAIYGGAANNNRLSLQGHINAAVKQANGQPIVVQLVIYDLPQRDCAAVASNGELSIAGGDTVIGPTGAKITLTGTGIEEYQSDYITPIYNILAEAPSNVRFVLVIEDDSLPNIVTNTGYNATNNIYTPPNCIAANDGDSYPTYSMNGVYVQGIRYALGQFHKLPNAYNYLDIGHHGWLGWPEGACLAYTFYGNVVSGATGGYNTVDGIITNTANYGPLKESWMNWNTVIPGGTAGNASNEVYSSDFYDWDPSIDELSYAAEFEAGLTKPFVASPDCTTDNPPTNFGGGFHSPLGFLIDTSRNGWGGPTAPTGPSTSTVKDTFVDASRIDQRSATGQWCNQPNQGIGEPPTVTPDPSLSYLQAYVWVKPPGESDGNYIGSMYSGVKSTTGDTNCDPAGVNKLAIYGSTPMVTNAIPDSPPAGTFWVTEFMEDVQNANPAIAVGNGFSISAPKTVTVVQGTTQNSSVIVTDTGTFNGTVALSITGMPAGVTASFTPASVTGSAGSALAFVASTSAVPGTYPLVITGVGNGTTETVSLSLVVSYAPTFLISVSPTTVNLPPGTNPTATITVTFEGGLTGSVSLSASGLPSGVNANFAPSSVNAPGGTITVNFNAQTSTAPGSYSVKMVGTNGTITNSVPLTLVIPGSGYSLSPSAPTLSIAAGQTGKDTITVTDQGGFTGAVTLTNSALPTGVTLAYGTNPATTTSALTFTVGTNAVAGTYPITITGNSGSLALVATTITLVISNGNGNFTLSASPAALTIAQGSSANVVITVTDTGGFTGSVTISSSSSPIGLTIGACGPTNPIVGNGSCTIAVTVPSSAAVGTYSATVTGTSGSLSNSVVLSITVTSATGYTISASLPSLTITQCGTGTDTITVTPIGGFTGSVALTATGIPTGVTVGFSPNPSTSTSVLTFTVACAAVTGTYPITITGTSGALSKSTTITLIITAKAGFTIAPSQATLSIAPGGSGTDTILVTDQGGFTSSVLFSASGLPNGVTAAFNPTSSTTSSILTLKVGSSTTGGIYPITITGTSGTLTQVTTITLTVTGTSPTCTVDYTISPQNTSQFGATITIVNGGSTAVSNWVLTWSFANGQTISNSWNGAVSQSGANVTVSEQAGQTWQNIPANGSYSGFGFNGTWNGTTNAIPTNFALNGTACTIN